VKNVPIMDTTLIPAASGHHWFPWTERSGRRDTMSSSDRIRSSCRPTDIRPVPVRPDKLLLTAETAFFRVVLADFAFLRHVEVVCWNR